MSVVGRRALYKEAQDRFTKWLTATAASRRQSMAPKKNPVPVRDLKACADLIITWKPPIDIDSNMLELLDDVIIGRKLASTFFAERGMQDEGHIRMIESLVDIHSKLREERRARVRASRARSNQRGKRVQREESKGSENIKPELEPENKSTSLEEDVLANMSAILQIEEVNIDSSARDQSKEADKAAQAAPMTIEVNEAEEARFALFCALQDMSELRRKVKEIWVQHKEGKVSASAAAVVSETAFALMKRTDDDLVAIHPQFCRYSDVLESVGLGQCFEADGRTPGVGRMTSDSDMIPESRDISALFCPMAGAMTIDFLNRWWRIEETAYLRARDPGAGDIWAYEHPPDSEGRYSFHAFAEIFYETFPDLWQLVNDGVHHIEARSKIPDMIAGFAQAARTGIVRLWHISATQSHFDVCEVLDFHEHRCDTLWHMRAQRSALVSSEYLKFCTRHYNKAGMPGVMVAKMQEQFENDLRITNAIIQNQTNRDVVTLEVPESWQPLDALRKFPLLAGANLDNLQSIMHRFGIYAADTGQVVIATAYLYLALRHARCLSHGWRWPDMDWFLKQHNRDSHLVKDPGPKGDMYHFLRHFMLSLGFPAASLARNTRTSRPVMTTPLLIQSGSEYIREMIERTKMRISAKLIDRDAGVTVLHKLVAAKRSSPKRSKPEHSMKLSATDLLDEYTAMRLRDEPEFCFDYFSFWMICAELVLKLCNETQETFSQSIHGIPRDELDATVVGDILQQASIHEGHGGSLQTSILSDVGKILERHVGKNGDRLSKEAAQLARGETPVSWSGRCCLYPGAEPNQPESRSTAEKEPRRVAATDHRGKRDFRKYQATVEDCPVDEE